MTKTESSVPKISRAAWLGIAIFGTTGAVGVLLDLLVGSKVLEKETQSFDEAVLLALRVPGDVSIPVGPKGLLRTVIDLNSLGGVAVLTLLTIVLTIYLLGIHRIAMARHLVFSVLGGWALENGLKFLVHRARPSVVPQLLPETTLSFPSGHAMMATVTYFTIVTLLLQIQPSRWARLFLITVAALLCLVIGLCRLYLGVHYPTDVLAGWCAGGAWVLICYAVGRRFLCTPGEPAG